MYSLIERVKTRKVIHSGQTMLIYEPMYPVEGKA